MTTLATNRSRAEEERIRRMILDLPKAVRAQVLKEMNEHAPELREIMRETRAVPFEFRVRDGDGWREVMSLEIAERYAGEEG